MKYKEKNSLHNVKKKKQNIIKVIHFLIEIQFNEKS